MSRTVLVRYSVPVYAKVEIPDKEDREDRARVTRVVVYDESLSDILAYEEEGTEFAFEFEDEKEKAMVDQAIDGEWPGWDFGW